MSEKIILGTAQFGANYGISNTSGNLLIDEATKIINHLRNANIQYIDTAINYSQSQLILSQIDLTDLKVISKIPSFDNINLSSKNKVINLIEESISRIGISNYHALLLHRPQQLLSEEKEKIVKLLDMIRKKNYATKLGISIYNPIHLNKLLELYPFDIVQAPLNILDNRILYNGYIELLKKKKIEFHARSIFLQGLLLLSNNSIPFKDDGFQEIFTIWHKWLKTNSLSPIEACIRFLYQIEEVDNIIIGVQSLKQLKEILKIKKNKISSLPNWPSRIDEKIINPSMWN
jgi:aryl-alcohol dehydrogenase-like predicted oxidoreductase